MATGLLVALVLLAVLACPAMMWFGARRGRAPACAAPGVGRSPDVELEQLRRRQRELAAAIRQVDEHGPDSRTGAGTT